MRDGIAVMAGIGIDAEGRIATIAVEGGVAVGQPVRPVAERVTQRHLADRHQFGNRLGGGTEIDVERILALDRR